MGSQMGSVLGSPPPSRYGSYELQHAPVQEESLMGTEGEWTSLTPLHNLVRPGTVCKHGADSGSAKTNRTPWALRVAGPSLKRHGCLSMLSAELLDVGTMAAKGFRLHCCSGTAVWGVKRQAICWALSELGSFWLQAAPT